MSEQTQARPPGPPKMEAPDLLERGGVKNGVQQTSDRRLFMQLSAFGEVRNLAALKETLERSGLAAVLYEELGDPRGCAVLTFSENESHFIDSVRPLFNSGVFSELKPKPQFSMFGRSYAIGYEPELEDWLLHKPRRVVLDPASPWAIWYPLRRTGAFSVLPPEEQKAILREHGTIGMSFGQAGLAHDVRLACHGLDAADNDFVIGLIGARLYPLSAVVERMRRTKQTSTYMEKMGPFFIGRSAWRNGGVS